MRKRGTGWVLLMTALLLTIATIAYIRHPGREMSGRDTPDPVFASVERVVVPPAQEVAPGEIELEALLEAAPEDTAEDAEGEEELVILTFNIRSGNNQAGDVVLESVIEEIRETGAHFIGLQEVERFMPRSGFQDQAKEIADALGYHYVYGSNINLLGVQYGNAFLSRFPILEGRNHRLPRVLLEPRGVVEAMIDLEGTAYHIYVTHLGLNGDERKRQVEAINGLMRHREGPIILMGDFNNLSDSSEMVKLDARMVDSAQVLGMDDAYTYAFYSEEPNVRIDRIYTSDNIVVRDHRVLPTLTSDHLRVVTKISQNLAH